jgi:hypothetical protein
VGIDRCSADDQPSDSFAAVGNWCVAETSRAAPAAPNAMYAGMFVR